MSIKEKVLEHLEASYGKSVSGSAIAESLGITRSAVWKAVNILRSEGYNITAVTNKGYCLSESCDALTEAGVAALLETKELGRKLDIFKGVDSAADFARSIAAIGAAHGTVIISEYNVNTNRRRSARKSTVPESLGIYMSIVIRKKLPEARTPMLKLWTAAAAAKAVSEATKLPCTFSGDTIICGGKPVGYIGCDIIMSKQTEFLNYAVTDVCLCISSTSENNKYTPLRTVANTGIHRSALSADILNRLEKLMSSRNDEEVMAYIKGITV